MGVYKRLGKVGEELAMHYLKSIDYQILMTNYKFSYAEVDIIAKVDEILVFVEVKTRSKNHYGPPELSVSEKKVNLLMDAAFEYMEKIGHTWEIRFDVITIITSPYEGVRIKHLKDAFVP
jgi:putative endonuclease